jgi:hypothetical protein
LNSHVVGSYNRSKTLPHRRDSYFSATSSICKSAGTINDVEDEEDDDEKGRDEFDICLRENVNYREKNASAGTTLNKNV